MPGKAPFIIHAWAQDARKEKNMFRNRKSGATPSMKRAFAALFAVIIMVTAMAAHGPVVAHAATKKVTPQVTLSKTSFTYNGKTQKPSVTVKVNGKKLSSSNYSITYPRKSVNAGTYNVTVSLKGGYSGSKTVSYKIKPVKPKEVYCLFKRAELEYTGKTQKAKIIKVIANLPSGKSVCLSKSDYSASVPSGKKQGTYKFTIKMKGNYTGSFTDAYEIKKNAPDEPRASW